MPDETNVDSFVLRFVREAPVIEARPDGLTWHGMVRHVQTNRERAFVRWTDALSFICEFVDLREELSHE